MIDSDFANYASTVCPQAKSGTPLEHSGLHTWLKEFYGTEDFRTQMAEWLSGAVQIPTESYDGMGAINEDIRWEVFGRLHEYLRNSYPLIYKTLNLTTVNTYGLVYHWQGSDQSLKPLLLTAHQDVVPVDPSTIEQWVHGPYSGYFDGTYVWGRGSCDDKSGLISIMSTLEILLDKGFQPKRTIVLAFGFDEEASGRFGAGEISQYLLEVYGQNGFAFLVDEGGSAMIAYGAAILSPHIAEKGYLDVGIEGIGIISKLLVALEDKPLQPHLLRNQTVYQTIQCLVHAPEIPTSLKHDIIKSQVSDKALARVQETILAEFPDLKYLMQTTQAIDLISGGVKVNALPERVTAVVNHRIDVASSVDAVKERMFSVLKPVSDEYNLSFNHFGDLFSSESSDSGSVSVFDAFQSALEPAPVSPAGHAKPWSLLSSTIRAVFEDVVGNEVSLRPDSALQIVVGPGQTLGNTQYYWKLTPHIFRFSPFFRENAVYPGGGIHTVNEAISIHAMTDQVRFFTVLILNTDESRDV
ncbi:hypothetical protein Clacol_005522 [Clathrus columnatus]|uniref:Peptidase M20 dimerisation domain-containing protein n=1 Tax=Clathrus columnatus TaxID=1419009 RepID=A0AAV5AH78_9AGAM|nr:hypothetical protein Clacol_005522 [Clathrus columnatus]